VNIEPGIGLLENAGQLDRIFLIEALSDLPEIDAPQPSLPKDWGVDFAEPRPIEPITDIRLAAQSALAHPLASLRLAELCGEATRAAIVLGVVSVELALALLLPVLDEISSAGTLAQNITILVATSEQADALRSGLAERAKLVVNDPDDLREQDDLGNVNGVPLALNYRASEADVLIAITAVQPDGYSGYTSAATSLIHTASSATTQSQLHTVPFLSDAATWNSRLQELPYQRILDEAARRAGLRFALSVLTNDLGDVLMIRAGDPLSVNESLLPVAQAAREADVGRDDYDVAFLDVMAAPQTLFEASAAAASFGNMPASPLLQGGLIVLQAQRDLAEAHPLAAQNFYDVMAQGGEADGILNLLDRRALKPGEDRAYLLAQAMTQFRVMVVGDEMDDLARTNAMLHARNLREATELAESLAGHRLHALSVARAAYTRPVFNARLAGKSDSFEDEDNEIDWLKDIDLA
jgi:nickel-dependent lactate racemase